MLLNNCVADRPYLTKRWANWHLSCRIAFLQWSVQLILEIWFEIILILQFSTRRTRAWSYHRKKYFFLLSIAYFTICCNLNARKKGIREKILGKWNYVRKFMICELWWCGGSAMHYWNIWKAHSDNNDTSFLLVWNDIPWNISRVTWSASPGAHGHTARSDQLPCARVTAFSSTSLFLELFWCEFWISLKLNIPVSKTYRPENDIFNLLITFSFLFWYLIRRMRS